MNNRNYRESLGHYMDQKQIEDYVTAMLNYIWFTDNEPNAGFKRRTSMLIKLALKTSPVMVVRVTSQAWCQLDFAHQYDLVIELRHFLTIRRLDRVWGELLAMEIQAQSKGRLLRSITVGGTRPRP